MLRIENLYKKYDSVLALDGLNMEIHKGELYGFVGPNGAGKTTTIRIISGLLKPTRGQVWIDGIPVNKDIKTLKSKIGYIPDFFGVYDNLTVMEYLEFYASAYGIYGKDSTKRAYEVLEQVELYRMGNRFVDELSRGMQQRLCLARAMIHCPQLLIMDEPASGLDPGARKVFKNVLKNLCRDGYTVLISSHILSELADMCTNVGIVNQGKMILQGEMEDIMYSIDSANPIVITIYQNMGAALELLKCHPLVNRISIDKNRISILFSGSREEEALLMKELIDAGIMLSSFAREHNSLESVFFHLIGPESGSERNPVRR